MVIDISEPGLFQTMSSYFQSVKYWETQTDPIYDKAARKEYERYQYLKENVLATATWQ